METYNRWLFREGIREVKCLGCLKVLMCFVQKISLTSEELRYKSGLNPEQFVRTIERLVSKGTIVKSEDNYNLTPEFPVHVSSTNELFDKCKELDCDCVPTKQQVSLDEIIDATPKPVPPSPITAGKRVPWAKAKRLMANSTSPLMKHLDLFYELTGGKSPSLGRDVGILSSLSQKGYSREEIEVGIRYFAEKKFGFNLGLLPWIMNEALAAAGNKNLTTVDQAFWFYKNWGEESAVKKFGQVVVDQVKVIAGCPMCSGKRYKEIRPGTYQRCPKCEVKP